MMVIEALLCALLGGVFVAGAIPKLSHPKRFVLTVLEYRVLPPALSWLYAWLVPPLEVLVSLLLLSGTAVRSAAAITALLLLSFITAVSINLARGREIDCGCLGKVAHRKIGWGLLVEDGMLLGAAIVVTVLGRSWVAPEPWSVFRLSSLSSLAPQSTPIPALICMGLALCSASFLRVSQYKESQYSERRYLRATKPGEDVTTRG